MPRLIALRRDSVAGADLGNVTYQIGLGATSIAGDHESTYCFSLLYRYPPNTTLLYRPADSLPHVVPPGVTTLVQVPISLAESVEELERIARVSAGNQSPEQDLARMTEAFNLMNNRSRTIAKETLQACVRDAQEVVKAYYLLRKWLEEGATKLETIRVVTSYAQREGQSMENILVCQP